MLITQGDEKTLKKRGTRKIPVPLLLTKKVGLIIHIPIDILLLFLPSILSD